MLPSSFNSKPFLNSFICKSPLSFNFKLFFSFFLFICVSCLPCSTLDPPPSLCVGPFHCLTPSPLLSANYLSPSSFNSRTPFFFCFFVCLCCSTQNLLSLFISLCTFIVQLQPPFSLCKASLWSFGIKGPINFFISS